MCFLRMRANTIAQMAEVLVSKEAFFASVEEALQYAAPSRRPPALLIVAVENTDAHGDASVARLAVDAVASRLQSSLRRTDLLACVGDTAIAVLLRGVRHQSDACAAARRLTRVLDSDADIAGRSVGVRPSVSLARDAHCAVRSADELIRLAIPVEAAVS